jgi:hypothetical protein
MGLLPFQLIKDGLDNATSKDFSIHPEYNALFDVPGLNVFRNPSCRAHSTDLGIFKKIFEMLVSKLISSGQEVSRTFEER